ncbi:MAG: hypothetical protein KDA24_15375 [Deltaproteobacteria bacterium]|nr:hypothetical protein [Deltaproteobacteria bacterium]
MTETVRLPIEMLWDGTPAPASEHASVTVIRVPDGSLVLQIDAPWHEDAPPEGEPGPTWALWEHEVVELFLLGEDEQYTEIEVGPHGHHLVLTLRGRRKVVDTLLPLDVSVSRAGGRWTATARVPKGLVPPGALRGNAYAIHGVGNARRYLAWTPVPGEEPDFHRLEYFAPLALG